MSKDCFPSHVYIYEPLWDMINPVLKCRFFPRSVHIYMARREIINPGPK